MSRTGEVRTELGFRMRGEGCGFALLGLWMNFVCALFALLVAGFGVTGVMRLVDRDDAIYRLARPVDGRERAMGVVRGRFTVRRDESVGALPDRDDLLCEVTHEHFQSGKGGGWRVDRRWGEAALGARMVGETGSYTVAWSPEHWRFVPSAPREGERFARRVPVGTPSGGRVQAQCVREGDVLFVEACEVVSGRLGRCGDRRATVSVGDGRPVSRVRYEARDVAWRVGCLGAVLVLVALLLGRGLRPRLWVEALTSFGHATRSSRWRRRLGVALAGGALLAVGDALVHRLVLDARIWGRGPATALVFVVTVGLLAWALAGWLEGHEAVVRQAEDALSGLPQGTLQRDAEGPVKLALQVAPEAKVVAEGGALVWVEQEVFKRPWRGAPPGYSRTWLRPKALLVSADEVTVRLKLREEMMVDLPAKRSVYSAKRAKEALAAFAPWVDAPREEAGAMAIEVATVAPGAPLLLVGVIAHEGHAEGPGGFRDQGQRVVAARSPRWTVMHAGDEQTLAASLLTMRQTLSAAVLGAYFLAGAMMLAAGWLAVR